MNITKKTGTANTTVQANRSIKFIVIHYTAGVSSKAGSAVSTASWFGQTAAQASADFIVDDATAVQYNPDPKNRYCWAVGGGKYNTKGGSLYGVAKNSNVISIEICSTNSTGKITTPNDKAYSFTDAVVSKAVELTQYLMEQYGIDVDHVIRHYDVNGKECPGIIGWNADSGSESAWKAFKARLTGSTTKTQTASTASGIPSSKKAYIDAVAKIAVDLYPTTKILPSVVIAQCCLETGYGLGSDSTALMQVNNLLGMKADLINSTWSSYTVWNGEKLAKKTPEYYNGKLTYITDYFRKYTDYRNCIEDYEMFLLHVKNNSGLKYAHVAGMTNPKEVITAISKGGYATDPSYIEKIIKIISENNFTKYDSVSDKSTSGTVKLPTYYRVQCGAFRSSSAMAMAMEVIRKKTGYSCFYENDGLITKIYCGSFQEKENAEARAKELKQQDIDCFVVKNATS